MKDAGVEPFRFEPTVFGAVRRYWAMVLAVAFVAMAAAIGYSLKQPKIYEAQASVTVPQPVSLQGQTPAQYFDSQVLLLQSQDVAQRAVSIADGALRSKLLDASDFSGSGSSLVITPPTTATPGGYGASIIMVSFKSPSATIAQVGANAVLQAFDDARYLAIAAQASRAIAAINRAIDTPYGQSGLGDLKTARTETLINEQYDLSNQPTVAWAVKPETPTDHGWSYAGAIGFIVGLVVGAALAFARASLRRGFTDRQDPAALYGVPLIGEIPAFEAEKTWRSNGASADGLLPMNSNPHTAAAESFRFAAGSIERIRAERGPRLSLVFVSPLTGGGKSTVVANLALAIAEGGTRVLAVDVDGDLTPLLLPGNSGADGLEQVLAGQRVLEECVRPSPFHAALTVLGSGPASPWPVTGAARSKAARFFLTEAKARYEIVLIDSPALLEVADAAELVDASDAAIIVLSANELIRDHLEVVDRLRLIGSDVVGYIYAQASARTPRGRARRNGSPARPADTFPPPAIVSAQPLNSTQPLNGERRPSSNPSPQG